jgi:phosphonoacetaldehyde hydrolase
LSASPPSIRLVVFDWAGTTVDHGCFGPVAAFVRVFARHGVEISPTEARGPMGLNKRDHLQALLEKPAIATRWRRAHGSDWTAVDLARLYRDFIPLQLEVIDDHARLVPGLLDCFAELLDRGIAIGATTGYFREAAERVYEAARAQGYVPNHAACAEDVPAGRPAPWMVFRVMQELGVYPPAAVVKVGDTVPDIHEGLNAGAWSVGVTRTGSEVGCTEDEWTALDRGEQQARLERARLQLLAAGAHTVVESLAELPALVADLSERLRHGERP